MSYTLGDDPASNDFSSVGSHHIEMPLARRKGVEANRPADTAMSSAEA